MKKIDKVLSEGLAFHQGDMFAEAEKRYLKALQLVPGNADALHLLGLLNYQQQREMDALSFVEQAIQRNSRVAIFWKTLGLIQRKLGQTGRAIEAYDRSLALDSCDPETWLNRGAAHHFLNALQLAVDDYQRAIVLRPGYGVAYQNLVFALRDAHLYSDALEICKICPAGLLPGWVKINLEQRLCLWESAKSSDRILVQMAVAGGRQPVTPFDVLSVLASPQEQLDCAFRWAETQMQSTKKILRTPDRRSELVRIGYLSADFQEHATAYLLAEVLELHDRNEFDVHLYSYGADDNSQMRQRLREAGRFFDVQALSIEAMAELIHAHEIDILVDLKGYTAQTRSSVLAYRPAPVQVNWLGYPGSMGSPHVDCLIADAFVIPPEADYFYSEKIFRMPHCYQPNDRLRSAAPSLSRQAYGLPEDGLVFACFTQLVKLRREMFSVWMEVLHAAPGSVLWMLEPPQAARENLVGEAIKRGIKAERLVFAAKVPLSEHLARYRLVDLALETFPYTSHTTASDALWMGCPLVTRTGETFASRVAGSILHAANFSELVTDSLDAYRELVLALVRTPERLRELRRRIEANRDTCPLFDTPRFTRDLEALYRSMLADR